MDVEKSQALLEDIVLEKIFFYNALLNARQHLVLQVKF